jgi:hypothetical protein
MESLVHADDVRTRPKYRLKRSITFVLTVGSRLNF